MIKIALLLLSCALCFLIITYSQLDKIILSENRIDLALERPKQTQNFDSVFGAQRQGKAFEIEPIYNYDITGLIVVFDKASEERLFSGKFDQMHIANVCIVWGENLNIADFNNLSFMQNQQGCVVKTNDYLALRNFQRAAYSGNRLISESDTIRKKFNSFHVGDIVRIQGRLVNYGELGEKKQRSSVGRGDKGAKSTEIIYVDHAELMAPRTTTGERQFYLAKLIFMGSLMFFGLSLIIDARERYHTIEY